MASKDPLSKREMRAEDSTLKANLNLILLGRGSGTYTKKLDPSSLGGGTPGGKRLVGIRKPQERHLRMRAERLALAPTHLLAKLIDPLVNSDSQHHPCTIGLCPSPLD
ncbi:hypothetical protein DSO57_1027322 [Entomophthora muscae]|uniref:Uncharacterized protein n=1 Tax=Entomophthora muscae TaxID=34485 RepID=A0ACC2TPB1_9FUNG|nr:hypothetical protein DSO57_1027322 [Entomophthora muscae]